MLPWDLFTISKMEFFGQVNFLKGALVFSDYVTTVSKKYSQEIQTTEYGFGLEGVSAESRRHRHRHFEWRRLRRVESRLDKFIMARIFAHQTWSAKARTSRTCLRSLASTNGRSNLPVIGIVSRFAAQKGFDLISQIMDRLAREDMIMVVLGTGDKEYEEMFLRLQKQFPQKIAVKVAYDNALAHKIEAGADMFLMPSRYEPCGLNQIYSLKYGTVPIVRATGGLDDTIEPWDARTGKGTGFKFSEYSGEVSAADHQGCVAGVSRRSLLAGSDAQWHEPRLLLGCVGQGIRQGLRTRPPGQGSVRSVIRQAVGVAPD